MGTPVGWAYFQGKIAKIPLKLVEIAEKPGFVRNN
jgi:hypothetical protein